MYVGWFVIFEFHLLYIDGHPYIGNGGGVISEMHLCEGRTLPVLRFHTKLGFD